MKESVASARMRDSPQFRRRIAMAIVGLCLAILGWFLTVVAMVALWQDPTGLIGLLLMFSVTGAGLFTTIALYCLRSWSVRGQIGQLEILDPGGSAWKALCYPDGQRSLQTLSEDQTVFFRPPLPWLNVYALFSEESLMLWTRSGDRLEMVAEIPRSNARYDGRDWRRPIFSILIENRIGECYPFSIGLTRGRFRRGAIDSDTAYSTVVAWCRDRGATP